jgi:dihydrolipoamide dehydrogenase
LQVIIVDPREALGGVCLHEGCVPSKTLLHIADVINLANAGDRFGIEFGEPSIDFEQVRAWNRQAIDRLTAGLESLRKKHGVELVRGRACFEDSRNLHVVDGPVPRIRFRRAIIATGSRAIAHPALPFDVGRILTPDEAVTLLIRPTTLLVVGCDYMAVEVASIYCALGAAVTLVDAGDRLLPEADADIVRPLEQSLKKSLAGVNLKTGIERASVGSAIEVTFTGAAPPARTQFDAAVICLGRRANIDDLRLDRTGATTDDGGSVIIDAQMRTTDPRVYAVGDVTGPPLLANRAIHQGRACAEIIAGRAAAFDATVFPMVVFTDPQVAWVGLTEQQAKAEGVEHAARKIPWGASGRAVGMGRMDGVTKLIYDPTSRLVLGVGIAGVGASEMIAEAALALEMGATITDLAVTLHPHPTRCELLSDAAWQADSADQ